MSDRFKRIAKLVLTELRTAARNKAPDDHSPESVHILLGPVVQRPLHDGEGTPEFYLAVMGGTDKTPATMCIGGAERSYPEAFRVALGVDLIRQRPVVVHDFDDELKMAQWAAAIWPCDQTKRILDGVRQERMLDQPAKGRA